ncbi:uncharacterized protein [Diabrotica undecimpunctata]|uniref:uncharacterized protein n=1 Tax=Diabrotica undecimpunctata TaxID=50387 RepID=UPI003B63608B
MREWLKRRNTHGASALLLKELALEDELEYKMCLRMTPRKFEELLNMVHDKIEQDPFMRDVIKPRVKLEITLNFLATGNSYRSLSHFFKASRPAFSKLVPEVCDAISEVLGGSIKVPSRDEWNTVAEGFKEHWYFPNCCGAIDGKHVLVKALPNSGSV